MAGKKSLTLLITFGSALLAGPLAAATLEGDYQLQGVYTSSVGAIGPLTPTGDPGALSFVTDTVNGQTQQVLQVGTNMVTGGFDQGGVQAQTNPFISSSNYSAVLLASFQISTADVLATKVMDFDNLSSDAGLYIDDATGLLGFYNGGGMLLGASTTPIVSGQYVQIVLTRDSATNMVTVYANGAAQFAFSDPTGLAILGDATNSGNAYLTLFQDDGKGVGGSTLAEGTLGDIARLRLYDGALTATEVAALDGNVPEPASWLLFAVGCLLLSPRALRRVRRGTR